MKRIALFGVIVVVIATFLAVWLSRHIKHRQIAMTLLEMHHDWAANDYHAKGMTVPRFLAEQGDVSASAAGVLGAYVQYDFQKDGIEWTKRLHLLRANTNSTTWVLYEFATPKDTNLLRMAWQHKLISVNGEP
jgi:hypothetical protein